MNPAPRYVLVSPARDEEATVGRTLESVCAQTVKPVRYIVVSDGSTDRTDQIVQDWSERYPFITLRRASTDGKRSFGSKVLAFQAGYSLLCQERYEFIGNLDADVTFEPDYFEQLLAFCSAEPRLGLVGGAIFERLDSRSQEFVKQLNDRSSVAGAVQFFRRPCFESFGGYRPMPFGGIDSAAEILARMHGWEVRTIDTLEVRHHRRVGTVDRGIARARFKKGLINYSLGYHPLFHLTVSLYRMAERPLLVGGILMLSGYLWGSLSRAPRPLHPQATRFLSQEQMHRLRLRREPAEMVSVAS